MMGYDHQKLVAELERDEDFRSKPYTDTVGKLSIGIGRNLTDVGLSKDEAYFLAENDIRRAKREADLHIPWWRTMTDARQRVIINMLFNMGWGNGKKGLSTFVNTLPAMEQGRYDDAAEGMLKSKWATQVGERADRLAKMMREG